MKKKRGLKRYYRTLDKKSFIEELDFSGGENSWFDLYHIHIDYKGLGNKSWKSRKQHLDALFSIAKKIEDKLKEYPKEFQYFIIISEMDSRDDCINIHTRNPNKSEFPILTKFDTIKVENVKLADYLYQKDYKIKTKILLDYNEQEENNYFLTKKELGLKIE